jgi:hypothetical protein
MDPYGANKGHPGGNIFLIGVSSLDKERSGRRIQRQRIDQPHERAQRRERIVTVREVPVERRTAL